MDGLINQTREQLWRIVNTFTNARREGKRPTLELALYEYGNDSLSQKDNWIRQVVPLTTNLDQVSEALFQLSTNGGSEYCGAVIDKATHELAWSDRKGDLKLIYIAGNEPFTQGPVDFHGAVKDGHLQGRGGEHHPRGRRARRASAGAGRRPRCSPTATSSSSTRTARWPASTRRRTRELAKLNAELNKTYIGYGPQGAAAVARQEAQDKNAVGMSMGSLATRAAAKASAAYDNADWDLVDAKKKGKLDAIARRGAAGPDAGHEARGAEGLRRAEGEGARRAPDQDSGRLQGARGLRAEGAREAAKDGTKTLDDALLESAKAQGAKAAYSF